MNAEGKFRLIADAPPLSRAQLCTGFAWAALLAVSTNSTLRHDNS